MAGIKQVRVEVFDLELGMFVSALDRPWSQTSFSMQGFALRSSRELKVIQSMCRYVYIDVEKSKLNPSTKLNLAKVGDTAPAAEKIRRSEKQLPLNRGRYQHISAIPDVQQINAAHTRMKMAEHSVNELYQTILKGQPLSAEVVNNTASTLVQSAIENPIATTWMVLLRRQHKTLVAQAVRSATWAILCARHMGLDEEEICCLSAGILLKDVYRGERRKGIGPTQAIEIAVRMLRNQGVDPKIVSVVKYHREKFNGTGVPNGIEGEKIPLLARIAHIAVTYDALIVPPSGKLGQSPSRASKYLYDQRGKAFQDELALEFIEAIGVYPLGTFVKLNSGETGIIIKCNAEKKLKPEVLVVKDAADNRLQTGIRIDLDRQPSDQRLKIASDLPADPEFDLTPIFKNFVEKAHSKTKKKSGIWSALFG